MVGWCLGYVAKEGKERGSWKDCEFEDVCDLFVQVLDGRRFMIYTYALSANLGGRRQDGGRMAEKQEDSLTMRCRYNAAKTL